MEKFVQTWTEAQPSAWHLWGVPYRFECKCHNGLVFEGRFKQEAEGERSKYYGIKPAHIDFVEEAGA